MDLFDTLTWVEILMRTTFLDTLSLTVPTLHLEFRSHTSRPVENYRTTNIQLK
jgi:hypothetical protein